MAQHNELGKQGEAIAKEFLLQKGYKILEKNWRYRRAEIDLIAKEGETLIFVEVKTRSTNFFGEPEDAVTAKKEAMMTEAAIAYMHQTDHEWAVRFDILAIIITSPDQYKVQHIEDAFFAGF